MRVFVTLFLFTLALPVRANTPTCKKLLQFVSSGLQIGFFDPATYWSVNRVDRHEISPSLEVVRPQLAMPVQGGGVLLRTERYKRPNRLFQGESRAGKSALMDTFCTGSGPGVVLDSAVDAPFPAMFDMNPLCMRNAAHYAVDTLADARVEYEHQPLVPTTTIDGKGERWLVHGSQERHSQVLDFLVVLSERTPERLLKAEHLGLSNQAIKDFKLLPGSSSLALLTGGVRSAYLVVFDLEKWRVVTKKRVQLLGASRFLSGTQSLLFHFRRSSQTGPAEPGVIWHVQPEKLEPISIPYAYSAVAFDDEHQVIWFGEGNKIRRVSLEDPHSVSQPLTVFGLETITEIYTSASDSRSLLVRGLKGVRRQPKGPVVSWRELAIAFDAESGSPGSYLELGYVDTWSVRRSTSIQSNASKGWFALSARSMLVGIQPRDERTQTASKTHSHYASFLSASFIPKSGATTSITSMEVPFEVAYATMNSQGSRLTIVGLDHNNSGYAFVRALLNPGDEGPDSDDEAEVPPSVDQPQREPSGANG
jgi:hypothetical protein